MVKRAPAKRRPRKAKPGTKGLVPAECRLEQPTGAAAEAAEAIAKAGGCVVGSYKEPLGGHPVLLSILPIDAVEPTPFQRDLSDAHHKRLADVISKTGRFLDPIIAVVAPKGGFWTPNGRHRLEAMRRLGAKSITALVVAEREVAWQILALNTEKAHNLKERSLEVIRIYHGLEEEDATRPESQFAFYLDEPAWSLWVSAMNASRASAVVLTIRFSGDWRALPTNHCEPPSRITRNGPRWCSTSRRKLRQR
jgi:ParB family chromosome partitioning protein